MAPKLVTFTLFTIVFVLIVSQLRLSYFRHDNTKKTIYLNIVDITNSTKNLLIFEQTNTLHSSQIESNNTKESSTNKIDKSFDINEIRNIINEITCEDKNSFKRYSKRTVNSNQNTKNINNNNNNNNLNCLSPHVIENAILGNKPWLCRTMIHYVLESRKNKENIISTPTIESLLAMEVEANQISTICDGKYHSSLLKTKTKIEVNVRNIESKVKNVILVALHDGLGNQMFQVSCGILLAEDFTKCQNQLLKSQSISSNIEGESMSPVVLLDEPISYREIFEKDDNNYRDDIEKGRRRRRRLTSNIKRSDGATALLQALYPNMKKRVFSATNLIKSSKSNHDKVINQNEKDSIKCLNAIKKLKLKREQMKYIDVNNMTNDLIKSISLHSFTDIDRLWRFKTGPGIHGYLKQFEQSWAFGTSLKNNTTEENNEISNRGDDSSIISDMEELRCIVVDGFFQKPFMYEKDKNKLKKLFELKTNQKNIQTNEMKIKASEKTSISKSKSKSKSETEVIEEKRKNMYVGHELLGINGLLPISQEKDCIAHIRTCEKNRRGNNNMSKSFYPPLPMSYYVSALSSMNKTCSIVWVVGPSVCLKSDFMRLLQAALPKLSIQTYHTKFHDKSNSLSPTSTLRLSSPMRHPNNRRLLDNRHLLSASNSEVNSRQGDDLKSSDSTGSKSSSWQDWGPSLALIADLIFLRFASNSIVLSVGSFSFWCGWLGNATQVHVPIAGRQQQYILYGEKDRFIYHDLR